MNWSVERIAGDRAVVKALRGCDCEDSYQLFAAPELRNTNVKMEFGSID